MCDSCRIRNEALKNKAWSSEVNEEVALRKACGIKVDQIIEMTGNIYNLSTDTSSYFVIFAVLFMLFSSFKFK